jgi:hypothetical protein
MRRAHGLRVKDIICEILSTLSVTGLLSYGLRYSNVTKYRKPRHFGNTSRRSQDKLAKILDSKAQSTRPRALEQGQQSIDHNILLRDHPLVQR